MLQISENRHRLKRLFWAVFGFGGSQGKASQRDGYGSSDLDQGGRGTGGLARWTPFARLAPRRIVSGAADRQLERYFPALDHRGSRRQIGSSSFRERVCQ